MDTKRFEGINGISAVDEKSPIIYFPNDLSISARRLTFYNFGAQVFFFDYTIQDNTQYVLYLEAVPEYRGGKWLEFLKLDGPNFKQHYEELGKFDRVVWLNVTPYAAPFIPDAIAKRVELTEKDKSLASKIYVTGEVMLVHDTADGPLDQPTV